MMCQIDKKYQRVDSCGKFCFQESRDGVFLSASQLTLEEQLPESCADLGLVIKTRAVSCRSFRAESQNSPHSYS